MDGHYKKQASANTLKYFVPKLIACFEEAGQIRANTMTHGEQPHRNGV